jgi:hypothetical protein
MLRRHVRKMLGELENGLVEAERVARIKSRKVKKKSGSGKEEGGGSVDGNGNGNEVVVKRAEYLRWRLGPGAFL